MPHKVKRRNFLHRAGIITGSVLLFPYSGAAGPQPPPVPLKALKPGDRVGLIAPASAVSRAAFEKTLENIAALGFHAEYTDNVRVKKGFLAGTDEQRLQDLHQMFRREDIAAVWCVRGGYGSARLLPGIDYALLRQQAKPFIGYSDITALHCAIQHRCGMTTFHGPVAASSYTPYTRKQILGLLTDPEFQLLLDPADPELPADSKQALSLSPGIVRGALAGGNLSLICSLMGTPFEPDFKGKVVFLEDIGEEPYRIDRMLTQLLLAGKLQDCAGIALGQWKDCESKSEDPDYPDSLSLLEVIRERLGNLGKPVVYGLPFGHVENHAVLPVGAQAELNAETLQLRILDRVVR